MGLSLRNLTRTVWEAVTPQDEGALRRASANLDNSKRVVANTPGINPGFRQQYLNTPNPKFNMGRAAAGSFYDAASSPRFYRDTTVGIGRGFARIPETASRSWVELFNGQDQSAPTATDPVRRLLYGSEPLETYQKRAEGIHQATAKKGGLPTINPIVAGIGLVASDLTPGGKARPRVTAVNKGAVVSRGARAGKNVKKPRTADEYMDDQLRKIGIDPSAPEYKQRKANILRKPQDLLADVVEAGRTKTGKVLEGAASGDNAITSAAVRAPRTVFSRFGMSDNTRARLDRFAATKTAAGTVSRKIQSQLGTHVDDSVDLDKIKMHLQDRGFVKAKYGRGKVKFNELNDSEKAIVSQLKDLRKTHNEINYGVGLINKEQYAQGRHGGHAARVYDIKKKEFGQSRVIDKGLSKQRKDASELSDDILNSNYDEITSTAIRNEIVLRNKAAIDVLDGLSKDGLIKRSAPNSGWVKLDSRFGKYEGKYADKQVATELTNQEIFASPTADSIRKVLDSYQDTIIGKADRVQKSFKTTLAPGTIVGNIASNIVLFARGSRINPITHTKNMAKSYARLVKHQGGDFDNGIYAAQKAGLDIGSGRTGFQLNGVEQNTLATATKDSKNPLAIAGRSYGRFDDSHKLAMFEELQRRGMSAEKAARRTNLFSQDYNNVGRTINMFADSPIMGKPFARYAVELLRLSKNAALYNPIGVAAGLGGFAMIANKLSEMAGESEEDRKNRESQIGGTTLPGTAWINKMAGGPDRDLSLNLAIGDSAVNIARATGINFPLEPGKDPSQALVEQLLPFPVPTRVNADGQTVINMPELISSLTLKPFAEQVANRDFMGRTITDPENVRYSDIGDKNKYENPDGSRQDDGKSDLRQRGKHLVQTLAPFANEGDSITSALGKRDDYYGQTRSIKQAAGRSLVGLKATKNDQAAREKRKKQKEFMEGDKVAFNNFVTKHPKLADSLYKFSDPAVDRNTNTKVSGLVTPERWSYVKADQTGELFKFIKSQAVADNKKEGKPLDPIYAISSPERVKEVLELRSRPSGDDIEREEILRATTDWYDKFERDERKFYDENKAFFANKKGGAEQNARVKAYLEVPHAEHSPAYKAYLELRYGNKDTGKQGDEAAGKAYFKAHADQLVKDREAYAEARLKEINAKRAIEGFPPLSKDVFDNVTFGFEADEEKVYNQLAYGRGYAFRRGGGGSRTKSAGSAYKHAISPGAGGTIAKPSVSAKAPVIAKAKAKGIAKPKVTMKKSRV